MLALRSKDGVLSVFHQRSLRAAMVLSVQDQIQLDWVNLDILYLHALWCLIVILGYAGWISLLVCVEVRVFSYPVDLGRHASPVRS